MNWQQHLISENTTIKSALSHLDKLAIDAIIFIVDSNHKLLASLTDGDIRRGLMKDVSINDLAINVANKNPRKLIEGSNNFFNKLIEYRESSYKVIPIINDENVIIDCINFRYRKSILPVDCVIMAGGKGERLNPLTITTPKPLLKIGEKPIIEYNLDNFKRFGISKCWITINYLGDQIEVFASNKTNIDFEISTVKEPFSMGTIGSIKLIDNIEKDTVLVCNSDLLNDVNLEAFYLDFVDSEADLSVVTIPYNVNVPYAIMELQNEFVLNLKEKPNFTYYSNGGIYIFKKKLLALIPENSYFTAIDFMEKILESGLKIKSFAHNGYWLDIGKQEDYQRAKSDILKLNLFHD
jgi:dTDP-glucose pyrophosphorylase